MLDTKTGKIVRHRRIDDTSWIRKGVPTRNSIENYNDIDRGHVKLRRSPTQGPMRVDPNAALPSPPDTSPQGPGQSAKDIVINYSPTYHITAHGGEDMKRCLATEHRKHIEQLTRDLAEVMYRNRRASFVDDTGVA